MQQADSVIVKPDLNFQNRISLALAKLQHEHRFAAR